DALYLRDVGTARVVGKVPLPPSYPEVMAFSPDGRVLATADAGGIIELSSVARGRPRFFSWPGHSTEVAAVAFTPDGRWVVSADGDGNLYRWDATTGKVRQRRRVPIECQLTWNMAFSADGSKLVVADMEQVRWLDASTGMEVNRLPLGPDDGDVHWALAPDGRTVAFGKSNISLWDKEKKGGVRQLQAAGDHVWALTFSPDSKRLFAGDCEGHLLRWDLVNGKRLPWDGRHASGVAALACSPDGRVVASSDGDGNGFFWDAETGKQLG